MRDIQVTDSAGGALVGARVRPRSRPGLSVQEGELVVAVTAAPVEGHANDEACRLLAQALGVPVRAVAVRTGRRSRTKTFLVAGLDAEETMSRLRRVIRRPGRGYT